MRFSQLAVLALLTCSTVAGGADRVPTPQEVEKELAARQAAMARRYGDLEQSLIRLAARLEKSPKEEDRARAARLRKAIELSGKQNVRGGFEKLIQALQSDKSLSVPELVDALKQQKGLADDIKAIRALLLDGDRYEELKKDIETIKQLIKMLDRIIRDQKIVRSNTEGEKLARPMLVRVQTDVRTSTEKLARKMGVKIPGGDAAAENPEPARPVKGAVQVQQATVPQKNAVAKIQGGELPAASDEQDQAIRKLEDARKQLYDILRQLRTEEVERVLMALHARCERMLQLQLAIYGKTIDIHAGIEKTQEKKPTRADEMKAAALAQLEDEIVAEVTKAIQLLESEGTAVAFPEVFAQLRDDTKLVSRRLGKCDVGAMTQTIERDIISMLREMIGALKKAEDEIANGPPAPPPPGGDDDNPNAPRPPRRLIDQLAELKMIRSLQVRVNDRTTTYGDRYKGEQAKDPEIQKELKNLSDRQKKIATMTTELPKEKNR
jgi:hypothetical protein